MSTPAPSAPMGLRAWVLIDGFNYFYAMRDAIRQGAATPRIKWLDYAALARAVVARASPGASLTSVRWYTAYVKNDPPAADRHRWYRKALEASGVTTVEGEYKRTTKTCSVCKASFPTWEEKATDVNIAIDIVTGAGRSDYDTLFLFSGDSDLTPAVDRARKVFGKRVVLVVPGWRMNQGQPVVYRSLGAACDQTVRLVVTDLSNAPLPESVPLANGKHARRPPTWA